MVGTLGTCEKRFVSSCFAYKSTQWLRELQIVQWWLCWRKFSYSWEVHQNHLQTTNRILVAGMLVFQKLVSPFAFANSDSNDTGKHLDLPALVGGHLRMCWKRGKNGSFLHHGQLHVVYRHAQHRDLCESLTHHHHHQTLFEDLQWM